jgi:hypothetical protein
VVAGRDLNPRPSGYEPDFYPRSFDFWQVSGKKKGMPLTKRNSRSQELADKCTERSLIPEERDEYEALIRLRNFVAILQAEQWARKYSRGIR